jgi:hypothetical protein
VVAQRRIPIDIQKEANRGETISDPMSVQPAIVDLARADIDLAASAAPVPSNMIT